MRVYELENGIFFNHYVYFYMKIDKRFVNHVDWFRSKSRLLPQFNNTVVRCYIKPKKGAYTLPQTLEYILFNPDINVSVLSGDKIGTLIVPRGV